MYQATLAASVPPSADSCAPVPSQTRAGTRPEADAPRAALPPDPEAYAAAERLERRVGYRLAKRAFDVCFSAGVLAVLAVPMLAVAAAIKLDSPGPAIFRQERLTKGGRRFKMWKFRSMRADAEQMLDSLKDQNEKDGPVFKIREDPRITRVGRFIRKTSIDELPQFVNVLAGDMSVVGPRPPLPREAESYSERDRQRLLVKGGITCIWQVQQCRDDYSFDEWVGMDLEYVKTASVMTDLKLIARTVGAVIGMQGS